MTSKIIAVVGSVTTASRLEKMLAKAYGASARIIHTPSVLGYGGCSYSVKTKKQHLPLVKELASKYKIKVKEYYIIDTVGGKEVYHAVSR